MTNKISVRQICFILLAYGAAGKLLTYPAALASACGNALIFPAAFNALLQTVVVWAVAYLSSKTDKTFFGLLKDSFGATFTRVVFGLFAIFFIVDCIIPIKEQQLFVHESFYDTIPSLYVFLPFFVFAVYAGAKKFNNAGRTADICLPVFAVTLAILMIMAFSEWRPDRLLPVLKLPFNKLAGAGLGGFFRFTESAYLLMFLGHFKYKKGDCTKITLSYAAGNLIVLLFLAVFYGVYGELAVMQPFALSKIAVFFSGLGLVGNIDLLTLYAFDLVLLFALVLNVQMSCYCLCKAFNYDNPPLYSVAVNGALLLIIIISSNYFVQMNDFFMKFMWIPAVIFAYLVPLCACGLRRKA